MRLLPVYTLALLAQICYNLNEKLHFIYMKPSANVFFSAQQCGLYISVTRVVFIQLLILKGQIQINKLVNCLIVGGLFKFQLWLFPFFIVYYPFFQLHSLPEYAASSAFECSMKIIFKETELCLAVTFVLSGASEKEASC